MAFDRHEILKRHYAGEIATWMSDGSSYIAHELRPATDTWMRGEGDYANLLLLPWNTARERYYEGRITGAEWDAYCNAWDALHPVEGQYGHVSIGCEAARCSHYRGGKP